MVSCVVDGRVAEVSELDSVTAKPPEGAACVSWMENAAFDPPVTLVGFTTAEAGAAIE